MALTPGSRLGSYEILELIGAGGMGEVYRATDTQLKRQVAIKVLPAAVGADADRLGRFQREAEVLAALNHPNIAHIFGFGGQERLRPHRAEDEQIRGEVSASARAGGGAPAPVEESAHVRFLVMELVEGPTLADRIAAGAIPLAEALPIARQIAEALEAAHDLGIVHRDLKPANIKVKDDGTVKVLDFGLAKFSEASGPGGSSGSGGAGESGRAGSASMSPTLTSPAMTQAGMILGTAAYMSPEQAKGRLVDKRSDLWAFGCVLFEMLTARRAFEAEDVAETMAHVLTKDPDWAALPATTPATIRKLLRRCLEKDRKRRLDSASAVRLEIDDALQGSTGAEANREATGKTWWPTALIAAAAALAGAAIVFGVFRPARTPSSGPVRYVSIVPPPGEVLPENRGRPVLSPDGRFVAFITDSAQDAARDAELWIRPLDKPDAQLVPGSEKAHGPFWSPDSRWVAFFAAGKLLKVEVASGRPQVICDVAATAAGRASGTWNANDIILFGVDTGRPIYRVKASAGATAEPATTLGEGQTTHLRPIFLPDGDRFVYHGNGSRAILGIYLSSLTDLKRSVRLLPADDVFGASYAPGYLLYARGNDTLWAQPFDARAATLSGEPVLLADIAANANGNQFPLFSVSEDGTLAYRAPAREPLSTLLMVDRSGKTVATMGAPDFYGNVRAAPDGLHVAAQVRVNSSSGVRGGEVRLFDWKVPRANPMTLTDGIYGIYPVWSSDSTRVGFWSPVKETGFYVKAASGQGETKLVVKRSTKSGSHIDDWSTDGKFLTMSSVNGTTNRDVMLVPIDGTQETALIASTANETQGRISPDGRWIAYTSDESGQPEIWLQAFPGLGAKRQISNGGGAQAIWRHDGKELFFLSQDRHVMAVEISGDTALAFGAPRRVFEPTVTANGFNGIGTSAQYAVSPDGQQFVLISLAEQPEVSPINLIFNWPALLERASK